MGMKWLFCVNYFSKLLITASRKYCHRVLQLCVGFILLIQVDFILA